MISGTSSVVMAKQCGSDSLFSTKYVFNEILIKYLKACHQITPKPENEQALMLLTLYILSYNLPSQNFKIPEKPVIVRILDKDWPSLWWS